MADPYELTDDDKEHVAQLEKRDAMVTCVDALQKLPREEQVKVLKCVRQFYGLPIVD